MRGLIRILPYAIVAGFALWCVSAFRADVAQLSLRPLMGAWDTLALVVLLSLINYAVRAVRWRWYLARLGYPYPVGQSVAIFVSGFAFTLAPGKLGEMVRARFYPDVPLTAVAAAFFAERALDLLATVALACLIVTVLGHLPLLLSAGFGIGAAMVCALSLRPAFGLRMWRHIEPRFRPRIPEVLARFLSRAAQTATHAGKLLQRGPLLAGFALGIVAWGAEGVGFGLLASAVEPHRLEIVQAVGIYSIAVLAGGLSFLPGGLGTTEAVMSALLVSRGFPVAEAMLVTLTCRVMTLWLAAGLGWLAMAGLRLELRVAQLWQ